MFAQYAFCPTCAATSPVDAPPCLDGHEDCPDRICITCGTALIVDEVLPVGTAERLGQAA